MLTQVKNLEVQKQSEKAINKSVAEYNLSKEPRLAQAKAQLAETYEQGIETQKEYEKNKQQFGEFRSRQC